METEFLTIDHAYDVMLLPAAGMVVTDQVTRNTSPVVKDESSSGSKIALWDDDNDFPGKVIQDIRKDPEIGTLLSKAAALLYSGGLYYGTLDHDDDGNEKIMPLKDARGASIRQWMRRCNINKYILEAATDFYRFANVFPEVILTRDRKQIAALCVQAAENCRWEKMDSQGIVKNCYINANFPTATEKDKETKTLPVLDPYFDAAEFLRAGQKLNYIYPLSYPSPGSTYYQLTDWNSIRASGWLSVSQLLPKLKKAILEKGMVVKYLIEIADIFWETKYPGFKAFSDTKKQELKKAELKAFSDVLTGAEKAGQSITAPFLVSKELGKEFPLWKITAIDDKMKDGKFLEEGKDASLYKSMAVGLHPALVGNVANSGLGGAGSNIREAYNLHMLMIRAHQDIILDPLYLVRDYNGWGDDIEFRFRNSFMNTLDKGKETTKTVS